MATAVGDGVLNEGKQVKLTTKRGVVKFATLPRRSTATIDSALDESSKKKII
jgi:hypothetical protein